MKILTDELKAKLLTAKSEEEAVALLQGAGMDEQTAERLWAEKCRSREEKALDLQELEAVSGGADRDWLTDGCAATVEGGSWCGSNDSCYNWDVTYTHEPTKNKCPRCGTSLYVEYRYPALGSSLNHYKCNNCGFEKDGE